MTRLAPIHLRGSGSPLRSLAAALAAVLTVAVAAPASAAPSSNWLDYVAIAKNRLDIGSNIEVSGNYAVINSGGELAMGTNLFHSSVPPDSFLAADSIKAVSGASANNVFVNSLQLNGDSNVRGTITDPFPFPLNITVPNLPSSVNNPCVDSAQNVTVALNQSLTLAPGCYRNLQVRHDASLELSGGEYIFRQVLIESDATVNAKTSTVFAIRDSFTTEIGSSVFPQSGNTADLTIYIGGAGNRVGNDALLVARVVAPNDNRFEFGPRATFIGNAFADEMNIFGVHLTRTPTPTPTKTPVPTPTPTFTPFVPPTPTPTPTRTPSGPTPTPGPPTPTPTFTPFEPPTPTPPLPTPTQPVNPPDKCPQFTSPYPCTR